MMYPNCEMERWEYCDNTVVLANADHYYTKKKVDEIVNGIEGLTENRVQEMINDSTKSLKEQVKLNSKAILERYTKSEVDNLLTAYLTKVNAKKMLDNYTKVNGEIMVINEGIEIK